MYILQRILRDPNAKLQTDDQGNLKVTGSLEARLQKKIAQTNQADNETE